MDEVKKPSSFNVASLNANEVSVVVMSPSHASVGDMARIMVEKRNEKIVMVETLQQAQEIIEGEFSCIFVLSITSDSNLVDILNFLKIIRPQSRKATLRVAVVSRVTSDALRNAFRARGVNDFFPDKIPGSTLAFKLNILMSQLRTQMSRKQEEQNRKSSRSSRQGLKSDAKGGSNAPVLVEAIQKDLWSFKGQLPRKVGVPWVIEAEGPDPDSGVWEATTAGEKGQEQWAWIWSGEDGKKASEPIQDVVWIFAGNRPVFESQLNRWRFVGNRPDLYSVKHGHKFATKYKFGADKVFTIAVDSPDAQTVCEESRRIGDTIRQNRDQETQERIVAARAAEAAASEKNLQDHAAEVDEDDGDGLVDLGDIGKRDESSSDEESGGLVSLDFSNQQHESSGKASRADESELAPLDLNLGQNRKGLKHSSDETQSGSQTVDGGKLTSLPSFESVKGGSSAEDESERLITAISQSHEIGKKLYHFTFERGRMPNGEEVGLNRIPAAEFGDVRGIWESVGTYGWVFVTPLMRTLNEEEIRRVKKFWFMDKHMNSMKPLFDKTTVSWLIRDTQLALHTISFGDLASHYRDFFLSLCQNPMSLADVAKYCEQELEKSDKETHATFTGFEGSNAKYNRSRDEEKPAPNFHDSESKPKADPGLFHDKKDAKPTAVPNIVPPPKEEPTQAEIEVEKHRKSLDAARAAMAPKKPKQAEKKKAPSSLTFFLKLSDLVAKKSAKDQVYKLISDHLTELLSCEVVHIFYFTPADNTKATVSFSSHDKMTINSVIDLNNTPFKEAPSAKVRKDVKLSPVQFASMQPIFKPSSSALIGVLVLQVPADQLEYLDNAKKVIGQITAHLGSLSHEATAVHDTKLGKAS